MRVVCLMDGWGLGCDTFIQADQEESRLHNPDIELGPEQREKAARKQLWEEYFRHYKVCQVQRACGREET